MIEQLRNNPDHPFHAYASTTDAARAAASLAEATTLSLLTQHRCRVISFGWVVQAVATDKGSDALVVKSIRITMEGEGEDLLLNAVASVSDMESSDWWGVYFAGDPFCELLFDHEERHDCSPREAALAVLSRITGIELSLVEPFFLVLDRFIADHFHDGDATIPLTPLSPS